MGWDPNATHTNGEDLDIFTMRHHAVAPVINSIQLTVPAGSIKYYTSHDPNLMYHGQFVFMYNGPNSSETLGTLEVEYTLALFEP